MKNFQKMRPRKQFAAAESCVGKTRWGSLRSAQEAVTAMRARLDGVFSSTVRPYRCGHCSRWHLGHAE